jgi:hypothetical protein
MLMCVMTIFTFNILYAQKMPRIFYVHVFNDDIYLRLICCLHRVPGSCCVSCSCWFSISAAKSLSFYPGDVPLKRQSDETDLYLKAYQIKPEAEFMYVKFC